MYPEIEKKEKTWKTHGILQRTAVRHWLSQTWRDQTLKTQHDKCSACHGLGHLGQFHWIFRCPRYASIIFFKFKTSTFPVIMRLVYSILFSLVIPKESYFLLFLNLRKRFIRTWIVQSYSWNNFLTRDTWCCESQVQLLVRFEQHHRARTYLRWLLLLFFAMPHPERYKKYQLGRSSIIFYLYDLTTFFLPNHPEKHPMTTPCFSTAAAAAPPSAAHPRRPRPDGAASGGWERRRRRGRAADLCGGQGGRGRQRRPWPWKGFRVVLGVALARWRKGFVHWQVIFCCALGCSLLNYPFFGAGMGLLKFG